MKFPCRQFQSAFRSDWIRSALWSFVLTRIFSENRFTLFGMRSQQETAIALQRQDDSWSI
ncbi:hypothetical protein ABT42_08360 [Brucella melitensis]|nr:hypothetical protein NL70_00315 [Brucella abortus 104M]KEO63868.1 hypothetical protein DT51_03990 [Brucella melitensis]KPJ47240.1 hypothetical protein ADS39_13845 [Brucella melitensis]OCW09428.1 hypothetical protein ABT42_08360 [Brucella melitensis]